MNGVHGMTNISLRTRESLYEEIEVLKLVIEAHGAANGHLGVASEQSKLESRIEIGANYVSGFLLAWLTWTLLVLGPLTWGWIVVENGFAITMVFTVVSIIRSYYWRRFFARGFHKVVHEFIGGVLGW